MEGAAGSAPSGGIGGRTARRSFSVGDAPNAVMRRGRRQSKNLRMVPFQCVSSMTMGVSGRDGSRAGARVHASGMQSRHGRPPKWAYYRAGFDEEDEENE
ncbi:hypothetical protein HT746_22860 [Burkholderia pyrrocinia]|uniref:hypothetical protein n=1 Tax=Burkholderia pyrrocinia TaxID=60550 RepID=UPI0015751EC0|nr:hypothetical protein [Burkholderia pyrrocinia]NTX29924.1 hypothetical protein [Burkholderia pyrrocinia]